MGQIVRRKRKGRPSNTDRTRGNSPVAPPSPVHRRRSCRRRSVIYNFDIDDYVDDDEFYDDEDEDEDVGSREKKLYRLLLCEDDSRSNRRVTHAPQSSSEDDDVDDDDYRKPSKKQKIDGEDDGDNEIEEIRGRKLEEEEEEYDDYDDDDEEEAGGSDFVCGTVSDFPKGLPMPDKRTLELILDKLQKKDIYGVYAEPVDPDELPDYYDVIKHPMDFATVRKKLAKGSYLTLNEFESDVLLICSNAMQYNAPDTIYYKQASSIQEQAKLRFQRLKANNVDRSEIELKSEQKTLPSFSLPKKQLKKPVVRTAPDPDGSETDPGATVRTGEFPNGSSAQSPNRPNSGEVHIAENSSLADNNLDRDQELLPGKSFMSKLEKKPYVHDENRRATYNIDVQPITDSGSIFSTFEGESKHFIPVGLHADHSYARSLSRFASTLGSNAWKIASNTIEQILPEGVKFGRGWVGEYEPLPTPLLIPENHENIFNIKKTEKNPIFTSPAIENSAKKPIPIPHFFSSSPQVELNKPSIPVSRNGNLAKLGSFKHPNTRNDVFTPGRPNPTVNRDCNMTHQQGLSDPVQMMKMLAEKTQHQPNNPNGFGFGPKKDDPNSWMSLGAGGFVKPRLVENTNLHKISPVSLYNPTRDRQEAQVSRFPTVHFQQPVRTVNEGQLQNQNVGFPQIVTTDLSRFQAQSRPKKQESRPPDLNIGYQSSTGIVVDSQQPDLALQL